MALSGHSVVSFDFEEGVINKMLQRKGNLVRYEVGDMLDMKYESGSFDVVLDKGSFDALCNDGSEESQARMKVYCDGVKRVLRHSVDERAGGYICISLL